MYGKKRVPSKTWVSCLKTPFTYLGTKLWEKCQGMQLKEVRKVLSFSSIQDVEEMKLLQRKADFTLLKPKVINGYLWGGRNLNKDVSVTSDRSGNEEKLGSGVRTNWYEGGVIKELTHLEEKSRSGIEEMQLKRLCKDFSDVATLRALVAKIVTFGR
ncbi:hypothetical protein Tco_1548096 [Tanacetum coccineum]